MNLKCIAPRLPGSPYKYPAILIGTVPARWPENEYEHCAGDKVKLGYTVDALVVLQTMDNGRVLQVPMFEVKIVDEWPERETT